MSSTNGPKMNESLSYTTLLCGRFVFRDGFAGAGWRWGKSWHYLAVIGFALFLWIVPTLIDLALGGARLPSSVTSGQIAWVGVFLFVTLIPGFGEEFGWRGYLLPHLAQQMSVRKAVFVHAVVWWAWHQPLVLGQSLVPVLSSAKQTGQPIGRTIALVIGLQLLFGFVSGVLHGVIFAYIWMRGRSLIVSSVYHAAYDGLRDSVALTIGLGPLTSGWPALIIVLVGVALLWRGELESVADQHGTSNAFSRSADGGGMNCSSSAFWNPCTFVKP